MAHRPVVVTRPCAYQGVFYVPGDPPANHDVGERLIHLGFAAYADDTQPPAPEIKQPPAPTPKPSKES